jgi:hypothetical protein
VRDAPLSASVSLSIIVAAFRALIIMDKGVSRLSEKQDGLINKTAGYSHGWNGRVFLRTSDVLDLLGACQSSSLVFFISFNIINKTA